MKLDNSLAGLAALTIVLGCGCSNKLIFATHTAYGLDVSGTAEVPNKVSLSYNRQEAAIVPRKSNGEAHSVFGGLDSDIHWWDGAVIKQTFATGEAAKIATGSESADLGNPEEPEDPSDAAVTASDSGPAEGKPAGKGSTKPLVFVTGTTFGLHLSAGEGQVQPSLLLGYRRAEGAYIPVPDPAQEVRSVYADLLINTKSLKDKEGNDSPALAITTNFATISGVRIKQSFATGLAAENLARDADVQAKLNAAAGTAVGALERLKARSVELDRRITLEVARLSEPQLDRGGKALLDAGLFTRDDLAEFKEQDAFEKSRLLRARTEGLTSEDEVRQKEKYLVLLQDIN